MIQSVRSSHTKYLIYLEEQKQKKRKKVEDTQLCLLNHEITMLDDKKNVLKELCKFVKYMEKVEEQNDFTKMRVYLTKSNYLKRKAEDNEFELSKIKETLSIL